MKVEEVLKLVSKIGYQQVSLPKSIKDMIRDKKKLNKREFEVVICELCGNFCPVEFINTDENGVDICPNCLQDIFLDTGAGIIATERQREIDVEGFTLENDMRYEKDELPIAASCYCLPPGRREFRVRDQWSLPYEMWKPTPENRVKELAKAGALIASEIDRIKAKTNEI